MLGGGVQVNVGGVQNMLGGGGGGARMKLGGVRTPPHPPENPPVLHLTRSKSLRE